MAGEEDILLSLGLDPTSVSKVLRQAEEMGTAMQRRLDRLAQYQTLNPNTTTRTIAMYRRMFDQIEARSRQFVINQQEVADKLQAIYNKTITSRNFAQQRFNQALGISDSQYTQYLQAKQMKSLIEGFGVEKFLQQGPQAVALVKQVSTQLGVMGESLKRNKTFLDSFFGGWDNALAHIIRGFVIWNGLFMTYQTIANGIKKTMEDIVKYGSEFQVQGVLFQAAQKAGNFASGRPENSGLVLNSQLLTDATALATKYGENVNTVAQDVQLWTKQTQDYNSALALTNQTLKFHLATGTQLEDVYRGLTALSAQAPGVFNLAQTPQLLQKITAEALVMGSGLHQAAENGNEMGAELNNGAVLYLKAMEEDAAALEGLGYKQDQIIAMNASLVQAFGNTGIAASEAGDKLQRVVGGLQRIEQPQAIAAMEKMGLSQRDINGLFQKGGDVLLRFHDEWDKLPGPIQRYISLAVGSTRQTDAFKAVLNGYADAMGRATKALKDKNAEDQLVAQMQDTYRVATERLSGAWQGFVIEISDFVLPMLTNLVNFLTSRVIPAVEQLIGVLGGLKNIQNDILIAGALAGTPAGAKAFADISHQSKEIYQASIPFNQSDYVDVHGNTRAYDRAHHLAFASAFPNRFYYNAYHSGELAGNPALFGRYQEFMGMTKGDFYDRLGIKTKNVKGVGTNSDIQYPPAPKVKDMAPDYENFAKHIQVVTDATALYIDKQKLAALADEQQIKDLEKKLRIQPENVNILRQITSATNDRNLALENENRAIDKNITKLESSRDHAMHMADHSKKGSKEQMGWLSTAHQFNQEILNQKNTFQENKNAIDQNNASMQTYVDLMTKGMGKTLTEDFSKLGRAKNYNAKNNALNQLGEDLTRVRDKIAQILPLIKDPDVRAFLTGFTKDYGERYQQSADQNAQDQLQYRLDVMTKIHDMQDKLFEDSLQMSRKSDAEKTYYEAIYRALKDYNAALKEAADIRAKYHDQEGDQLAQQYLDVATATEQADIALARYNEQLKLLEDTAAIKALKTAFDDLAASMGNDIIDNLFGKNAAANQENLYDSQIASLQQEKSLEDALYRVQKSHSQEQVEMHQLLNYQLDQEVKNIERAKKAEQDRQNHPTLLKQFAQNFTKSLIDELMKQLVQNTMTGILGKFIKSPDNQSQINNVLQTLKSTITASTPGSMYDNTQKLNDIISNGPQSFYQSTQVLKQSFDQFSQNVSTLSSSTSGGGGASSGIPGTGSGGGFGSMLMGSAAFTAALFGNSINTGNNTGGNGNGSWVTDSTGISVFVPNQSIRGASGGGLSLQQGLGAVQAGLAGAAVASQGGLVNAVTGGLSGGLGALAATGNPYIAAGVGVIDFLTGMIHHDDPAKMPDKYDTANYLKIIGELTGSAGANGHHFSAASDPIIQQLGGQPILAYIQAWVKKNLNSPDKAKAQLAQQLMGQFGDTGNGQLKFDHDIANIHVVGGSLGGNYYDVYNQATSALQEIMALQDATNTQPMVGFNQAGGGFFPYSWDTPGYDIYSNQNNPATSNLPPGGSTGGGTSAPSPSPGGGKGRAPIRGPIGPISIGGGPVSGISTMSLPVGITPASQPINVIIPAVLNVDGRLMARSVQSHQIQSNLAGYRYIS